MAVRRLRLRQTQVNWALLFCLSVSVPASGEEWFFWHAEWHYARGQKIERIPKALIPMNVLSEHLHREDVGKLRHLFIVSRFDIRLRKAYYVLNKKMSNDSLLRFLKTFWTRATLKGPKRSFVIVVVFVVLGVKSS